MEEKNDFLLLTNTRASLSQSLQYSLDLLSMNNLELRDHIQELLEINPFLTEDSEIKNDLETLETFSFGDRNFHANNFLENIPYKFSVKDEISIQMAFLYFSEFEKEIAEIIIDWSQENRYLTSEFLKYISNEKKISYADLLKIINKMKTLSPVGMFSFNLHDKIKTILEKTSEYDRNCELFFQNLSAILSSGISTYQKKYILSDSKMSKIIPQLKKLSLGLSNQEDVFVRSPDIIICEKNKTELEGNINEYTFPSISIDKDLYKKASNNIRSAVDKKYIKEQIISARLLIKSINYRNSTLIKVAKELVYQQYDFFIGNKLHLQPISIKTIANSLFLHESTIRKAIRGKIVMTPRGMLDMKSLLPKEIKSKKQSHNEKFFEDTYAVKTRKIPLEQCSILNVHEDTINKFDETNFEKDPLYNSFFNTNEIAASEHSIKEYIKVLIHDEPKNSPYSDNNIVCFLNSKGINISRRTISKYRNVLDIPNAVQRSKIYGAASSIGRL